MILNAHEQDGDRGVSLMAKDQYMREVRWTPRLTDEEQEKLLQRVERGNVERVQPQPNQWVLSLARHAREELAASFQPLVISLARRFAHLFKSMDWQDVVQEGNIGLVDALDCWGTSTFEGTFVLFAASRIRQAFFDALRDRDGAVHIPTRHFELFARSQTVGRQLRAVLGREARPSEIAAEMGIAEGELKEALEAGACRSTESLQGMLQEDRDEDTYDFVALYQAAVVAEDERQVKLAEVFQHVFEQVLSPSQRQVAELRYGFGEAPGALRSQEKVADLLGVTQASVSGAEIKVKECLGYVLDLVYLVDGRPSCVLDPLFGDGYCTTHEVAQLLGVTEGRVRYYASQGDLPYVWRYRCGQGKSQHRVFEKAAVMEFARARGSVAGASSVA